jgi:hypothetical protein
MNYIKQRITNAKAEKINSKIGAVNQEKSIRSNEHGASKR